MFKFKAPFELEKSLPTLKVFAVAPLVSSSISFEKFTAAIPLRTCKRPTSGIS